MISEIIILLLAIPSGYLIAWLARDELIVGRKWFRVLIILSIIVGIWFYLVDVIYVSWTAGFIFIVSLISLMKSNDEKWFKDNKSLFSSLKGKAKKFTSEERSKIWNDKHRYA